MLSRTLALRCPTCGGFHQHIPGQELNQQCPGLTHGFLPCMETFMPPGVFDAGRKTVQSYNGVLCRLFIILSLILPFLIYMCLANSSLGTAQVSFIIITALVSTLMLAIGFFALFKQMTARQESRRNPVVCRRQRLSAHRASFQPPPTTLTTRPAQTNLGVHSGSLNFSLSPLQVSNMPNSISSFSVRTSLDSPEVMLPSVPLDDLPSYDDAIVVHNRPLTEVHRISVARYGTETPPPSYDEALGSRV